LGALIRKTPMSGSSGRAARGSPGVARQGGGAALEQRGARHRQGDALGRAIEQLLADVRFETRNGSAQSRFRYTGASRGAPRTAGFCHRNEQAQQ